MAFRWLNGRPESERDIEIVLVHPYDHAVLGSIAQPGYARTASPIGDFSKLLGPSLILGLEHPSFMTGDTHLRFGRLALLSPTKKHPLIPFPQRSRPNPVAR